LAIYVGEDKYSKTILCTDKLTNDDFILTPHEHPSEIKLDKSIIIHYHCWINRRYRYHNDMQKINFLKSFMCQ